MTEREQEKKAASGKGTARKPSGRRGKGASPGQRLRSQQTREDILNAAEIEFSRSGYDATRTKDIAERAGITHGMLHYYFDTKAALYETVIARVITNVATLMPNDIGRASLDYEAETIAGYVRQVNDWFSDHPHFSRLMMWEVAGGSERLEKVAGPIFDLFAAVTIQMTPFEGMEHDPRDLALSIMAACLFYFFPDPIARRYFGEDRFGPEDRARRGDHMEKLVIKLLKPEK